MKRLILTLLLIVNFTFLKAQVFSENFDGPGPYGLTSTGTPGWVIDPTFQTSPANSMRGRFSTGGSAELTSTSFNTTGNTYVVLNFKQICKVDVFDTAKIEISVDGGTTWTKVTSSNSVYTGGATDFVSQGDAFSEGSYPGDWSIFDTLSPVLNSWWKTESFDISVLAGNQPDVRIRFVMLDDQGTLDGMAGRYGWLLDDVAVIMSPCELVPPTIIPQVGFPFYSGTVYNLGPYDIYMNFTDNTVFPLVGGELYFSINGVPSQFGGMFPFFGDSTWYGQIPPVNIGDTICWYVEGIDNCGNLGRYPASGCIEFIANDGPTIPFCDNFDFTTGLWTTDSISGTNWEIGAPTPVSPKSGANVMGISLAGTYLNSSTSSIMTPIFDFSGISICDLEFYRITRTENNWDGVTFEFSTNSLTPPATWTVIGTQNDPNGTNWYNGIRLFNQTEFAWCGTTLAQNWTKTTFKLGTVPGLSFSPTAQFRFLFKSDASVTGVGFYIDDFCISEPCDDDIGLNSITAPVDGSGIPAGTAVPIDVVLENFGLVDQTTFNVFYSVNGGTPVSTPFTGTLTAGGTSPITLSGLVPPAGSFNVCVWTDLSTDCNGFNDTLCLSLVGIPTLAAPYCDDFEGPNVGWYANNDPAGSPNNLWEQGAPAFGATSLANSGANAWDVNLATAYSNTALSYLYTPFFDCSTITGGFLSFALNYNTDQDADGAYLEYSVDNGATWNAMPATGGCATDWFNSTITDINGNNHDAWSGNSNGFVFPTYKLCCIPNLLGTTNKVQFRFVFSSDFFGQVDGVTMDDFCINGNNGDDIGVYSLANTPPFAAQGTPFTIVASVTNYSSTATYTSFPITYSVTPGTTNTFNWTGTLPPCSSIDISLPSFTMPAGTIDICAWTGLVGDINSSNDTSCTSAVGVPVITAPYCDDFEGGNVGWVPQLDPLGNPGTVWELGTPSFGATSSANSGSNAWDVNLTTNYTGNAYCYLYSPFCDLTGLSSAEVSFAINYDTETGWDGVKFEYTIDGGITWTSLEDAGACAENWYNPTPFPFGPWAGSLGWRGQSNGWIQPKFRLCCANGILGGTNPVRFRFAFRSDASVQNSGFSMDDFCIEGGTGQDIGVSSLSNTTPNAPVGLPITVVATVTNYSGTSTVTSFPISYTTSTGVTNTITWTGSLAPCSTVDVTLPPFSVTQGAIDLCAYTSLAGDLNTSNDTTCTIVVGQPLLAPTYLNVYNDDFENGNIGWAPGINAGADPNTVWEFGTPNSGNTVGAHSPTTCWDVNLNSQANANANCFLTTPYFDLSNANGAILKFWQNRDLGTFDPEFFIEYDLNNSGNWQLLTPAVPTDAVNWYNNFGFWDDRSFIWLQSSLKNLQAAIGGLPTLIQFRFVYTNTFGFDGGVSVDDFELFVPIPLSVSTLTVNTTVPNQLIFPGQPISFSAPIKNNGINLISNTNATLTIDGNIVSTDFINYIPVGGLAPDSTLSHAFSGSWIAVPGFHEVCVYTDSPNGTQDLSVVDDTACVTVLVFDSVATSQLPFCTSFESGAQWVTANADSYRNQSIWELGTPAKPVLNGAHTGLNAWTLNLATNYTNTDSSGLFSSLFRVQAGHCYKLGFWQQFKMEYGMDGGAVDYSTDYGVTWNRIDFTGAPNITLFGPNSNYTYVASLDPNDPSKKGFTGNRNNWFFTEKTIRPDVNTQLIVRWKFASDYTTIDEGWSIDDVCFTDLGLCTPLGIDEYVENNFGLSQNFPNPAGNATSIEYAIPASGNVRLVVTDMIGQTIAILEDSRQTAGVHRVDMNTANLAEGMYLYTLVYEGEQITRRMIIAK